MRVLYPQGLSKKGCALRGPCGSEKSKSYMLVRAFPESFKTGLKYFPERAPTL